MDKTKSLNGDVHVKAPKNKNSEVRKEQNRIASRAYREKRKQKLALLDQILKTEIQDPSSRSSEPDDSPNILPAMYSRHTSRSLGQNPQNLVPIPTTLWPSASQTSPSVANFEGEGFGDVWVNGFDHSGNIYGDSLDFKTSLSSSGTIFNSTEAAHQFLPAIPSMMPCSPMSLDPVLCDIRPTSHLENATHSIDTETLHSCNSSLFDESLFSSNHEPPVVAALESLSKLNEKQQQQLLNVIYRQKSLSPNPGMDSGWDLPATHRISSPTDQFLDPGLHQQQNSRASSRSPAPRQSY